MEKHNPRQEYHDCLNCELAHVAIGASLEESYCQKELNPVEINLVYKQHEINSAYGRHAHLYLEVFNKFSAKPKKELVLNFYGQLMGGWILKLM